MLLAATASSAALSPLSFTGTLRPALSSPPPAGDADAGSKATAAYPEAPAAGGRRRAWASFGVAALIGGLVALQALTLVYASRFTLAYIVQLIFLMTPLLAAVFSRWALRQPTPRGLWPALAVALAGSALVIAGQWRAGGAAAGGEGGATAGAVGASNPGRDLAIGLALAVVSMVLLASYLVLLQITQHMVTGVQVMWGNTYVALIVFTPLACAVEGMDWSWVLELSGFDWGVMVFAGFFIDALNTIWTQSCARVLGAAIVSLFISFRLVSSVIGSIILMGEVPRSPLVWAGMAGVVACMTGFMALQAWSGGKGNAADGGGDIESGEAPADKAAQSAASGSAADSDSCLDVSIEISTAATPAK
jgi:drug/metabolite transporter (DMT)-like permease